MDWDPKTPVREWSHGSLVATVEEMRRQEERLRARIRELEAALARKGPG